MNMTPGCEMRKQLKLREAAKFLKVSDNMLYRLVGDRDFPAYNVGGHWRIDSEELERLKKAGVNLKPPKQPIYKRSASRVA